MRLFLGNRKPGPSVVPPMTRGPLHLGTNRHLALLVDQHAIRARILAAAAAIDPLKREATGVGALVRLRRHCSPDSIAIERRDIRRLEGLCAPRGAERNSNQREQKGKNEGSFHESRHIASLGSPYGLLRFGRAAPPALGALGILGPQGNDGHEQTRHPDYVVLVTGHANQMGWKLL